MSKLKTLKESRAAVFAKIDELRTATDGREMTSEEQERWNTLLAEYEQADHAVEAEERYVDIERRQAEQQYVRQISGEQPTNVVPRSTAPLSATTCCAVLRIFRPNTGHSSSSVPASRVCRAA